MPLVIDKIYGPLMHIHSALTGASVAGTIVTGGSVTGTLNGVNDTFTTSSEFETGSSEVYLNGLRQALGIDYTESGHDTIIFTDPPHATDIIIIDYIVYTAGSAPDPPAGPSGEALIIDTSTMLDVDDQDIVTQNESNVFRITNSSDTEALYLLSITPTRTGEEYRLLYPNFFPVTIAALQTLEFEISYRGGQITGTAQAVAVETSAGTVEFTLQYDIS